MDRHLIVVRHGNTFEPGAPPRRIGRRTDPPLTAAGLAQAERVAAWLAGRGLEPGELCAAPLARTLRTARAIAALTAAPGRAPRPVTADDRLSEIDHGPDEDKTEPEVEERLGRLLLAGGDTAAPGEARAAGRMVLDGWNREAKAPPGWEVDPPAIERTWRDYAERALSASRPVLAVTSNGVARFSPAILPGGRASLADGSRGLKIAPGALCWFLHDGRAWRCAEWNLLP